jgi:hypothetical protein
MAELEKNSVEGGGGIDCDCGAQEHYDQIQGC